MNSIQNLVTSIINKQNNFCCLCLEAVEYPVTLDDEIAIDVTNFMTVEEILNVVFIDQIYNFTTVFNSLCHQCIQTAVNYYKFLTSSQKNVEYLSTIIDGISNNFEYTVESQDNKSLYVSVNLQDLTSKQYYDSENTPDTLKGVLKRFTELDNPEIMLKQLKKEDLYNNPHNKSKVKKEVNKNDILYEKKSLYYKCKDCFKVYATITKLKTHCIRVHALKTFKCPECPRKYGSEAILEIHKAENHCMVICSECGKTFSNRMTLKLHEMSHNLTLICQDCGRSYKSKATFRKHKLLNVCEQETRAHPSKATYTCDYCSKKYTQKVSLRVHIQHEHGNYKSHVCEWCGKKFWAPSRLKAHIVRHTKEKNFPCNICGGKFVTKESLLYHTRKHTGDNPYKCNFCDSKFPSASRRSDHEKRQHVGATLECDVCHCKFKSKSLLQKHKKTHEIDQKCTEYNMHDSFIDEKTETNVGMSKDVWQIEALDVLSSCNLSEFNFTQQSDERLYFEVPDDCKEFTDVMLRAND